MLHIGLIRVFGDLAKKFLKHLICVKLPKEINFIKVIYSPTENHHTDNSKNLVINAAILKGQKKKQLKKLIKAHVDKGFPLLEPQSKELLAKFKTNESTSENQELINTLSKIMPAEDLKAFRCSLYVRDMFSQHESIDNLKQDIIRRWGIRGSNICNLCTSYYFEKLIIPMYDSYNKKYGADGIDKFKKVYEIIVSETPFILFLLKRMDKEEITRRIIEKIKTSKKYGAKQLYIHALGKKIIEEVGEVLDEIKRAQKISFEISSYDKTPQIHFYKIDLE